jgi:hypothetical protein
MFGKVKQLWAEVRLLAVQVQLLQHDVDNLKKPAKKPVAKKTK